MNAKYDEPMKKGYILIAFNSEIQVMVVN